MTSENRSLSTKDLIAIFSAVVGLIGTITIAYFSFRGSTAPLEISIRATQTAESRRFDSVVDHTPSLVANTVTATQKTTLTQTPTTTTTPTEQVTPSETPTPVASPIPQLVSRLSAAQKITAQKAGESLLVMQVGLPLIVKDDFENNDYGWPVGENIFAGGIECDDAIEDGVHRLTIRTADGPAWCGTSLMKVASDFALSVEQQLANDRNADIFLYYRMSEDAQNFYFLQYNPQTQLLSVGLTKDGQNIPIINSTYVEEINKTGINKVTLLVVGDVHTIYLNDKLIAIFTDDRLAQGKINQIILLQEANQEESLLIDNYDLRGNQ